jgi:hypothetical protein
MEGGVQITLPKSEWTITENTHEAIVSREVFAKVQEFWDKPKSDKEPYYKGENTEDILRAKIYCGNCGSQMFRKRTGHKNYSYLCTKGVQYTTRACDGMRTSERILKNAVLGQILDNGLSVMLKEKAPADMPIESDRLKAELTKAKTDIGKNSRYLIGLYESLKGGDITETEYRELKSTYELRMASLEEQINTLQDTIKASIRKEQALDKARNSAMSVKTVADLTTDVIAQTIEKIIIHDRESIETIIRSFNDETAFAEGGIGHE